MSCATEGTNNDPTPITIMFYKKQLKLFLNHLIPLVNDELDNNYKNNDDWKEEWK